MATSPDWLSIRDFRLVEGRFFTAAEDESRERVAVLGAEPRRLLFPDAASPVGRFIRLGDVPFRVVGVLEAKGLSASGTATEDDKVMIPFGTGRMRLFGTDAVKALYVELADRGADGVAEEEVASVLRAQRELGRRGGPALRIDGQRVLMEARLAAQAPLRRMLFALGGFSLTVAAVGAMATMLLSVRERQREIGLRIAVGARRRDLVVQFLTEALALAVVGGAIGVLLGTGVATMLGRWTRWELATSARTILVAAGGTMLIGVLSGVIPAVRAARLDAIDSLRAE
jgi:putative ABC transport system permease protein